MRTQAAGPGNAAARPPSPASRALALAGAAVLCLIVLPAAAAVPQAPTPELRALVKQAVADSDTFHDRYLGEVWLMDMSNRLKRRLPDPHRRIELLRLVHREAIRAGLPPEMVLAVIDVESNFDRFAISKAGARGLMQVMPFWLKEIGRPHANLFQVQTNLRIGCTILKYYLDQSHGSLREALARYNGSIGQRWYSDRVLDALATRWFRQ